MQTVRIADREIGPGQPVFVIAEIGQNHNGRMDIARKLIDMASRCGADAAKFCKRDLEHELTSKAWDRPYTGPNSFGATYGEHREALELSPRQHAELAEYARARDTIHFASVCDVPSVNVMLEIGVPAFKVASRDLTNLPLVEHIAKTGLPVIQSTGMSRLKEIDDAVEIYKGHGAPLVLFHCVSVYPADHSLLNLRLMDTLRERYDVPVGYSGHHVGVLEAPLAAALGAVAVEKHITLSRAMPGTDQAGSLEEDGLRRVVRDIRNVQKSLGDGIKRLLPEEEPFREKLARSIASATDLPAGTVVEREMLMMLSPGTGLGAKQLSAVVGRRTRRDIAAKTLIQENDLD